MNLSAELERLAARDYREEGIPMLIVADGLASEAGAVNAPLQFNHFFMPL